MPSHLVSLLTSADPALRHRSLEETVRGLDAPALRAEAEALEEFRRTSSSLYERVRSLFFLYSLHRFQLPARPEHPVLGRLPFEGVALLQDRRFEEALQVFRRTQEQEGPSHTVSSALSAAYHLLGFQTLADQVRQSVRSFEGNAWMFQVASAADQPLRLRPELTPRDTGTPCLREYTPVRMDLSHSGWSDIFFLGMDHPEGARVLNVSIDLGVHGRDAHAAPPIETTLQVLDEPILRLQSLDLDAQADLRHTQEVFDFAKDYLGLLRAGVIASGLVPPAMEDHPGELAPLLARVVGPGRGLHLTTCVRGIPKGSRLAVSTNLLASLISVIMRATGQTGALEGALTEAERRTVAARAILGEWLGGSGGGWQDSGGLWPAIKLIEGVPARPGDPEHGISRGCLLPRHRLLGPEEAPPTLRQGLEERLILFHGGMAQDVGPVLEMVTEKYLLRSPAEWQARQEAGQVFDRLLDAVRRADLDQVARATDDNYHGPLTTIIPWASNHFTETLIARARTLFGADFQGFWMLGGMSGGGMGMWLDPRRRDRARQELADLLGETKREMERALPFAMDPVVYDFAINDAGSVAVLEQASTPHTRTRSTVGARSTDEPAAASDLDAVLAHLGFDPAWQEDVRARLRSGQLGLAQNRLPARTVVEDVRPGDVTELAGLSDACRRRGQQALAEGRLAVVTLAAGVGSRWTQGAGVVKALHPFCRLGGRHRTFLDVHQAKVRRTRRPSGASLAHVITTSHLTHEALQHWLETTPQPTPPLLSPGRSVGLRMVPMARDLRFQWEEQRRQRLDERAEKVQESLQEALIAWAGQQGEGEDYRDNLPNQCLHPLGHFYEVPHLLKNGVLRRLLREQPGLSTLLVHNIDTLGADVDARALGWFLEQGADLAFEVVPRRWEDQGGGLARVDGRLRLVEGLALPREEDEYRLSYYNSMTTWVSVDALLRCFQLDRQDLIEGRIAERDLNQAVRRVAARLPAYVTLKEVKKRWGHGQEDRYPVSQFEQLWSDLCTLEELDCRYLAVPRFRGQQLKEVAQLDGWLRDGSAAWVESQCEWGDLRSSR